MGALSRRRGFSAALIAGASVGLLAATLAFGAPGSGTPARISLRVPQRAEVGVRLALSGSVIGAAPRERVLVQGRSGGGWAGVGHAAIRRARYSTSVVVPDGDELELRAALVAGRRVVATSPIRRVAVTGDAAETPPTKPGSGGHASEQPPTAASASPAQSPTSPQSPATEPPVGGTPPTEPPVGGTPPTEPPTEEPPPTEPPATTNSYWGAWIGNQLTGEEAPWDMNAVTKFEEEAGKAPSLIEFASPFSNCSTSPCSFYEFPTTPFEAIRRRGAIPVLSWSSQSLPSSVNEPEYQLADVAEGRYDTYIRRFAAAAAAWGHPFFLRFDWEMNGTWFPWAAGVNGNTAADYVAAWRHVHQIFVEAGATNASWVWCPYVNPNSTLTDMASLYPGDEDVDWTCLDGYNWGPSASPPRHWRSFSYLFGPSYRQITEQIAPTKPMLVGETASSETGGSKEEWIDDAFAALPGEFPRIQGLIWFDKYDDGMDWPIETSSGATAAFKAGIADPRYQPNSYGSLAASPVPAP